MRDDDALTAALTSAITGSHVTGLLRCRIVGPLPAQVLIVKRAMQRVEAAGLRLPAPLAVRWVDGRGVGAGTTVYDARTGAAEITLDAYLAPPDLLATAVHECVHAADWLDTAWRARSTLDRERHAVEVTATLMGWR